LWERGRGHCRGQGGAPGEELIAPPLPIGASSDLGKRVGGATLIEKSNWPGGTFAKNRSLGKGQTRGSLKGVGPSMPGRNVTTLNLSEGVLETEGSSMESREAEEKSHRKEVHHVERRTLCYPRQGSRRASENQGYSNSKG